ncbi:MAG: LOG family protein [Myxococcota bacterium]
MSHQPTKAYKNLEFLNSPAARPIRILCEFEETRQRLLRHGVHNTIVFFGSARTRSTEDAQTLLAEARQAVGRGDDGAEALLRRAEIASKMSTYYEAARELSARLTRWSMEREGKQFVIASGAGPGIMEAANRGAAEVEGGQSVGLGISLPFEAGNNDYVTRDLSFEFHYFFTRKYWFLYLAKGMVCFPGGFGTMDELFETLTLVQTGKIKKNLPIVLFGADYWSQVINTDAMAEMGTISPDDVNLVHLSDTVDDAFEYLTSRLD